MSKKCKQCSLCGRFKRLEHQCPKDNPFKNRKHKEETLKILREKCGFNKNSKKTQFKKGHKLSIKSKMKQINKMKEHWKNPNHVFNSLERNRKISIAFTGDKHPNWLGGKSFEPYTKDFNRLFKDMIRERDGFVCIKCWLFEEDCKKLYKQKLHIHHIDYVKQNTIKENCCALCLRCNIEVNKNRPHWIKFFQSLLSERYGYKYSEDGKVILELNFKESI